MAASTKSSLLAKELAVALSAVRAACRAAKHVQGLLREAAVAPSTAPAAADSGSMLTRTKTDCSPVTVADYAAQVIICKYLAENFPNDQVVAEEESADIVNDSNMLKQVADAVVAAGMPPMSGGSISALLEHGRRSSDASADKGERYWTIDPIDGTKGFVRLSQYAVCLALLERPSGRPILGVLGSPNLASGFCDAKEPGALSYAVHGHGAFEQPLFQPSAPPQRLSVSGFGESQPSAGARVVASYEASHSRQDLAQAIASRMPPRAADNLSDGAPHVVQRLDSQAKYALLARGDADVYARLVPNPVYAENIWDHASGYIIVKEAGGCITDMNGKDIQFNVPGSKLIYNRGVLASCGPRKLHDRLLEIVSQTLQ